MISPTARIGAQFELFYRIPGLVGERAGLGGGSGLVFRWPAVQVS